jgi:TRAP-type C4-dicarboxylate transport system permease small subunit
MIALVALALMTVADVLMRWLFNAPIDGVADVGPLVIAVAVAATFPFAAARRCHVALGFFGSLLGPRARAWLDTFAAVVTTVFFVLFAWQFVLHAIKLAERGQTTWILGLPVAPWWSVVAFFMVLCAGLQVLVLRARFRRARNGEDDASAASAALAADDHL